MDIDQILEAVIELETALRTAKEIPRENMKRKWFLKASEEWLNEVNRRMKELKNERPV